MNLWGIIEGISDQSQSITAPHALSFCSLGGSMNEDIIRYTFQYITMRSEMHNAQEQAFIDREKWRLVSITRQRAKTKASLLRTHLHTLSTGILGIPSSRMALCQGFLLRKIALLDKVAELPIWWDSNSWIAVRANWNFDLVWYIQALRQMCDPWKSSISTCLAFANANSLFLFLKRALC